MRRLLALTAALLLLVAGCSSTATDAPDPEPPKPPLRLMVAGDSIVDGYYASKLSLGVVPLLVDALSDEYDVTSVVVGESGARAFRVAGSVERETVGEAPVDVAVLEAGANDVGKSTPREFADGYRRLIAAVRATSPDAELVCLGPWNDPQRSAPYEDVVRRLCAGQTYLALSDLYARAELRGPAGRQTELGVGDGFHPNDAGHAAIVAAVTDALS